MDDELFTFGEARDLLRARNVELPSEAENIYMPEDILSLNPDDEDRPTSGYRPPSYPADNGEAPPPTNVVEGSNRGRNVDSQGGNSSQQQSTSSARRRVHSMTSKLTSLFDVKTEYFDGKEVVSSVCRGTRCKAVIPGKDNRRRKFHVMICPDIAFDIRKGFFDASRDKDKPPLLIHPWVGVSVAEARSYYKSAKLKLNSTAMSALSNSNVLEVDPVFSVSSTKKTDIDVARPCNESSETEQQLSNLLLVRLFVEENLPFALLSRKGNRSRAFAVFSNFLRSGIRLPSSKKIGTDLLQTYSDMLRQRVKSDLTNSLYEGHATLMFDSSDDVNQMPMTSVLVRVTGRSRLSTKTYYMKTNFSGTKKSDADFYVKLAEDCIGEWIGFERVSGVVTDNAANVKSARERLMRKYGRLVASQDQAHVADRLMVDIGKIGWIRDVIKFVSQLVVFYRRFRKLKARLLEKMELYNSRVRQSTVPGLENVAAEAVTADRCETNSRQNAPDAGLPTVTGAPQSQPDEIQPELSGLQGADRAQQALPPPSTSLEKSDNRVSTRTAGRIDQAERSEPVSLLNLAGEGYEDLDRLAQEDDEMEEEPGTVRDPSGGPDEGDDVAMMDSLPESAGSSALPFIPSISRFARTMKKMSNVRFASSAKLLSEYRSVRPILMELVKEDDFEKLFSGQSEEERDVRQELLVDPILDDGLARRVEQAHSILEGCCRYLRVFDKETALSSEVFEATKHLETTISHLPLRNFPEPRRENKEHLMKVFMNRKEGPLPGMKRVRITLLSDLHFTAVILDPYRSPRSDIRENLTRFRRHLAMYLEGADIDMMGRTVDQFVDEMVRQYQDVRSMWVERRIMRMEGESASGMTDEQRVRDSKSPIAVWTDGIILNPDDPFERKALQELVEFACRTLSVSPTATATERTFSFSSRIQTHQRSSLAQEKVEKLLFSQWNTRVIQQSTGRDKVDMENYAELQSKPMQYLRQFRKAVVRAYRQECRSQNARAGDSEAAARAAAHVAARLASRNAGDVIQRHTAETETQESSTLRNPTSVNQRVRGRGSSRGRARGRARGRGRIAASRRGRTLRRERRGGLHRESSLKT